MRWSQIFIPTLRDDPADAEAVSHKLMLRAGLVRQLGAGIYSKLPLGFRAAKRVERIVREEMERIGAQEFHLPVLHPGELWKESGRWDQIGPEMFRLKDRRQGDYCLGMTHEEVFTAIARDEIRSYRQLPQIWFQIQTKLRDEARPKSGVLRGREFTMKDSYSFDADFAGLDRAFDLHARAYRRIFERCGLDAIAVQASSGAMGGKESVEFMSISDAGEDWTVICRGCEYAANLEKAVSVASKVIDPDEVQAVEKFATPGIRTIQELSRFTEEAPAERQIKTLLYIVEDEPTLFLLRGDHELNEVKIAEATGTTRFRPATAEECQETLGAHPGSLGAIGVSGLTVYADDALEGRRGMVTGANQDDFHVKNVDVARDLERVRFTSLRNVVVGDPCRDCGEELQIRRTIELGHIFKLGLRYSESMGLKVLNERGTEVPVVMGSYGIGIERLVAAVIEAHHDDDGIVWPWAVAPFHIVVTPISPKEKDPMAKAEAIYEQLAREGYDVVLDDRDERPGVKFKDADLVGFPLRIVPGPRALEKGQVELVERASREKREIPLDDVAEAVREAAERLAATRPR
ncbi:MAG TPA: proline--tRNA ligase [Vicinamibacteria bacterium]|nr:proline--tRNA ligase [Vicinamibacteria bacterium]